MTPTWEQLAALGIVEGLDGCGIDIDGSSWDADAVDYDGNPLPPGQLYLTSGRGDDRMVRVRVEVTVVDRRAALSRPGDGHELVLDGAR